MKAHTAKLFLLIFMTLLSFGAREARAQGTTPAGPVYVVQAGDTLWDIAQRFGILPEDLIEANNLVDPNDLRAGDELIIPGLDGIQGRLETRPVQLGETLRSLSRKYQAPAGQLARLNHLVSPAELYAGNSLIVLQPQQDSPLLARRAALAPGQSLLELAVQQGVNPWNLVGWNDLAGTWAGLPGDVLHLPGEDPGPGALPPAIQSISFEPLPFVQGKTARIRLQATGEVTLSATFREGDINFFTRTVGEEIALQGLHALTEPGIYPFDLRGSLADGTPFGLTQFLPVAEGNYAFDPDIPVDPATIDPQVTRPEDAQWTALAAPVTPERLWNERFASPVAADFVGCYTSWYGNRRSYNLGGYKSFHTGLDFCGAVGNPIYAPAPGVVVFTGFLTVRGNATMIDHGWGVYTGYMHQSEILVQAGQRVETGDQIGLVGGTGRVSGPHLHFEVWVGGVQVDPLEWLEEVFP